MNKKVYNVLFLCTGNSVRSIIAEVLLNSLGKERFHAFSAGRHPLGTVHPLTIKLLKILDYPFDNLRSKCIHLLISLSIDSLDPKEIQKQLRKIGETNEST